MKMSCHDPARPEDRSPRRMLPKIFGLCLALLPAAPALASDRQTDTAKSTLGFKGSVGGNGFDGRFKAWRATIAFDPADPAAGHAEISIDMASAVTGAGQRDQALTGSDWFDARHAPEASFDAKGFVAKGGNQFEAPGILTIRGVSKAVTLPFTLEIVGDNAHAIGTLDILRDDFGIGQGEWAGGDIVGLKVAIVFDLQAKRTSS